MEPLYDSFKFGSHEDTEFRNIGMNVAQNIDGDIVVNHDHYVEALEGSYLDVAANVKTSEVMNDEGQI